MNALAATVGGKVGPLSIDLSFTAAEVPLVIVGPNGAGKTSALLMILGALKPQFGRVTLDGTALFDHQRGIDIPVERRRIGYLPQRYALFPHLSVLGNVMYGIRAPSRAERVQRALEMLQELDVSSLSARRISELSGGETQRVALARALASHPHALLMDEPLAALDAGVRRDVRRFLADRLRDLKIPTVVVTHDVADAEILDGDIVVIEGGAVVQRGRLAELCTRPETEFVRQFVERRLP